MPLSKPRIKEVGNAERTSTKSSSKDKTADAPSLLTAEKGSPAGKTPSAKKPTKSKDASAGKSDGMPSTEHDSKETKARSNPIRLSLSTRDPENPKLRSPSSEIKARQSSSSTLAISKGEDEESSMSGARQKTPYPTFSKAHSKEAVSCSVENLTKTRSNAYTPPLTETSVKPERSRDDLKEDKSKKPNRWTTTTAATPPSPPLTALDELPGAPSPARTATPKPEREGTGDKTRSNLSTERQAEASRERDSASPTKQRMKPTKMQFGRSSPFNPKRTDQDSSEKKSRAASLRRALTSDRKVESPLDDSTPNTTHGSTSTSVPQASHHDREPSLVAGDDTTPANSVSPVTPQHIPTPPSEEFVDAIERLDLEDPKESNDHLRSAPPPPTGLPPPPPPPPHHQSPMFIPRVDYLLKNGGLAFPVPRGMSNPSAAEIPLPQLQQLRGGSSNAYPTRAYTSGIPDINSIFTPYCDLLDAYSTVLAKNGSLAVATGHRSVARRLLDRLENVFARDISEEICDCIMCHGRPEDDQGFLDEGLGWGEILEWVSGRRGLPHWPALNFASHEDSTRTSTLGLGIDARAKPMTPAQKLDLSDLPEEWHDHYRRQTQKTKASVDRWLAAQPEKSVPAPQEVDDDTMNFAILTYLPHEDRHVYTALMGNAHDSSAPMPRSPNASVISLAPSNVGKTRSEFITQRGLAIQRLYHLTYPPRDPEVGVFLLKHPELHNVLTTLSIINANEWEILISGRFDGFLWNGPEPEFANVSPADGYNAAGLYRNPSWQKGHQTGTPFSNNGPGGSPGPFAAHGAGAPVSIDEDAEIQVLNEMERDIFDAMNSIEDAFERLHEQAESVRRSLIDRSSGLMSAAAARRSGTPYSLGIAGAGTGTPLSGEGTPAVGGAPGPLLAAAEEDPWENISVISDLRPDDSASNCFAGRKRRRRRHGESGESGGTAKRKGLGSLKRTPVYGIEEEDEGEAVGHHQQQQQHRRR